MYNTHDSKPLRLAAKGTPPLSNKLKVLVMKSDLSIWLLNDSSEDVTVQAGELFGFNYGTFQEKTQGGRHFCWPVFFRGCSQLVVTNGWVLTT